MLPSVAAGWDGPFSLPWKFDRPLCRREGRALLPYITAYTGLRVPYKVTVIYAFLLQEIKHIKKFVRTVFRNTLPTSRLNTQRGRYKDESLILIREIIAVLF
jgi:hypothetical protein